MTIDMDFLPFISQQLVGSAIMVWAVRIGQFGCTSAVMASKIALVTGAARGLGRSIADQLLKGGYKVCITDVLTKQGQTTRDELAQQYGVDNVTFKKCDVTQDVDFTSAYDECSEEYGPISLLVNNAGLGNEKNWAMCNEQ